MRRAVLLAVLVLAGCGGDHPARSGASVARVVDGDTIRLADGTRVRLVQIDAPEAGERECFAAEATRALERLLPVGTQVELERDPALDARDRFGRVLRYVLREGTNVNVELVRSGAAAPYFFRGDRGRYADDLLEAAEEARDERRGLWGACPAARLEPVRALASGGG
jgi:endonuclease YncB( thermonuclease family)